MMWNDVIEDKDEEKRRENAVLYTVLSHSHSYYSVFLVPSACCNL